MLRSKYRSLNTIQRGMHLLCCMRLGNKLCVCVSVCLCLCLFVCAVRVFAVSTVCYPCCVLRTCVCVSDTRHTTVKYCGCFTGIVIISACRYPEEKLQWIENSADCQLKLAQHNYELWQRYMLHSATLFGLTDAFGGQPLPGASKTACVFLNLSCSVPVGKHIPMLERHCEGTPDGSIITTKLTHSSCPDPVELKFANFHKKQERKKQEAAANDEAANGEAANGEAANGENA